MIDALARALAARGYDTLTPVQTAVGDPALAGRDLLVSAQTGSGKTVGFGLAIAPDILEGDGPLPPPGAPRALVIAPTRELALQVRAELAWLFGDAGAVLASCVGGMDSREERRALQRGAHIVVATPGRLRDHLERGHADLTALRAVVLDEADEMLDLGFAEDLEFILAATPATRRTLMFSATVPPGIAKLAASVQTDAARIVTANEGRQHADIDYRAYDVATRDAEAATINLLRFHDDGAAIVFANTRAAVARLTARLSNRGFRAVSLSGELTQSERTHALQAMRDGRATVCVATDIAARGIDLPGLDLVIHAELPTNAEALLHRSGRTGRAGRRGVSALVVPPKARRRAERLLKTARLEAEWLSPPDADTIRARDEARLLDDPLWQAEIAPDDIEFAERLVARHDALRIAAAFLHLSRQSRAAPEDLSPPEAPREKGPRAPFGPSRWITLSVGRESRAEPRWILPLLCRVGGLDKSAIGAIRIEAQTTRVEIAEAALPGLLAAAGPDGTLDGEVRLISDAEGQDTAAAPASPKPPAPPRAPATHPAPTPDRADAAPRDPAPAETSPPASPRPRKPATDPKPAAAPRKRAADAPPTGDRKPARKAAQAWPDKPKKAAGPHGDAKPPKRGGPKGPGTADAEPKRGGPKGPRPGGGMSKRGGPKGAQAGDAGAKRGGPKGPRTGAKPASRPSARDTSQRYTPPTGSGARPGRKPGKPRGSSD